MISSNDLNQPKPSQDDTLDTKEPIDVKEDVIPIYAGKKQTHLPNPIKLVYDIVMLLAIVIDLGLIFFDQIMMSTFFANVAHWLWLDGWLGYYQANLHKPLATIGGFFTLFLIGELLVRWALAIYRKTYYRWFFFPFVHWYEVLGCFPLLRPLRLLRALIIIKRLHEMDIQVVPLRLIKTAKFYGHILLEELSDRVILTAVDNFRSQMRTPQVSNALIETTFNKNRVAIEQAVAVLLQQELTPKLHAIVSSKVNDELSVQIGQAVERALVDTPELRRYLKLIPIAGSLIESQLLDIGNHIGQNVTSAVNKQLLSEQLLDELMKQIAKGVSQIDITRPEIKILVSALVEDGLNAFEQQIKIQQWKHTEQLQL